ncbi:MAG: GTPase Era [Ferrimicrobium sp.]
MPQPELDPSDQPEYRAGFVAVVGRANVGKSSLVNALGKAKLSIVSWHPNTTRRAIRAIIHGVNYQLILVDTPGAHRQSTALGRRLDDVGPQESAGADSTLVVIDARRGVGTPEVKLLDATGPGDLVVVNKIDAVPRLHLLGLLDRLSKWNLREYLLASARNGEGIDELLRALVAAIPVGDQLYPDETQIDIPRGVWVADLVREQLLFHLREELPHSVECQVESWENSEVSVVIYVERESQKGIVIGKDGAMLRSVRHGVRRSLPRGLHLTLVVRVAANWQRDPRRLTEFGY